MGNLWDQLSAGEDLFRSFISRCRCPLTLSARIDPILLWLDAGVTHRGLTRDMKGLRGQ